MNANHVQSSNAASSIVRTELEVTARNRLMKLYRFLKTQPGLENLTVDALSPECGVRETAVIQGRVTITLDDYRSGRLWKDAVCNAFYSIDLHQHG
jgi:hypothetical protein